VEKNSIMGWIPPNLEGEWTVPSYTLSGAWLTKPIHPSAWMMYSPKFVKKVPKILHLRDALLVTREVSYPRNAKRARREAFAP
jgi:hypothetical protein